MLKLLPTNSSVNKVKAYKSFMAQGGSSQAWASAPNRQPPQVLGKSIGLQAAGDGGGGGGILDAAKGFLSSIGRR